MILDLTISGGLVGLESLKRLTAIAIDPDVRGIVSSAYSSDAVMSNYRAHGLHGVMPKPYRPEDLEALVDRLIGEQPVERS